MFTTAEDYANHICQAVNSMAETVEPYCHLNEDSSYQDTRSAIINNVANSMSDRCKANHAAIRIVNSEWDKTLNELNCHLHPLDSIASATRSALKHLEEARGHLYGKDCVAANIILQMSKLRYKDGKGDPQGFTTFMDINGLPQNILPRYRGNRLHVLFHNAGILIQHHNLFTELLTTATSLDRLRSSLSKDFGSDVARVELQVLGLLGKHLTGPWMKRFYTSVNNELNYVDDIKMVENVLISLKEMLTDPTAILTTAINQSCRERFYLRV